jgi:hypothetical protein
VVGNQCSWLRSFGDLYLGDNTYLGETFEVMIYYLLLLWSECVEEGLGGMSHFVNLPSLLVLQCCCLLMWGVFLRETFWIVLVKLILCVLLAPKLHPVFSIVLVCQRWVWVATLRFAIEVPMELKESEIKVNWSLKARRSITI